MTEQQSPDAVVSVDGGLLFAWCPGCERVHVIPINSEKNEDGSTWLTSWDWDKNLEHPTLNPSILVQDYPGHQPRCHSYIRQGYWQFISDCEHGLADQTVRMLRVAEWKK